ncbi:hypothetical protein DRQ53_13180 [bacterium]|nr:MAG: hypothetical protein DRQ53_13180 [bacterium]
MGQLLSHFQELSSEILNLCIILPGACPNFVHFFFLTLEGDELIPTVFLIRQHLLILSTQDLLTFRLKSEFLN